jgi:hypothetical protein
MKNIIYYKEDYIKNKNKKFEFFYNLPKLIEKIVEII